MGLADKLRSLDQAAVRAAKPTAAKPAAAKPTAAKPTAAKPAAAKPTAATPSVAIPPVSKPVPRPRASKPVAMPAATAPLPVVAEPVVTMAAAPAVRSAGRAPKLRALGWRIVAVVAAVLAVGGRRGLLGPAGAVVVGLVLTIWWGPWFYLALGIVTAVVWIWALKIQVHEPTDNNY